MTPFGNRGPMSASGDIAAMSNAEMADWLRCPNIGALALVADRLDDNARLIEQLESDLIDQFKMAQAFRRLLRDADWPDEQLEIEMCKALEDDL